MYEKLSVFEEKLISLEKDLSDINVINDSKLYQKKAIEHAEIEPIVMKYREYKEVVEGIAESKEMLNDKLEDDFKEMVKEELNELQEQEEEFGWIEVQK